LDQILPTAAVVAAVFVLAGVVKGVVGLGLPTVAMGLLTLAVPPAQAAALLLAPSLVTNVWQAAVGPGLWRLAARLWPMLAAALLGTLGGIGSLATGDGARAGAALGAALLAYALVALRAPRLRVPPAAEWWCGPLVGFTTGLVTGATGVFVIPAVPYLQALGLPRDELVQALGLSFTVSTLGLGAALALQDAVPSGLAVTSALAIAPALLGMALGQRIRARVEPAVFRIWFLVSLAVLGAWLALRGLAA
jgi:hypothetical protein